MKRFVQNVNIVYVYIIYGYTMADDVARDQYGNPRGPSIWITFSAFSIYQYIFPKILSILCVCMCVWTEFIAIVLIVWEIYVSEFDVSRREKKIRTKFSLKRRGLNRMPSQIEFVPTILLFPDGSLKIVLISSFHQLIKTCSPAMYCKR